MYFKKIGIIICFFILISSAVSSGVRAEGVPVETMQVSRDQIEITERVTSKFTPYKTIDLPVEVSGVVTELNVDIGETVSEGEVLLKLDRSKLNAQLKQAEANLESARANLQELRNGPTEARLAQARASYQQAQASLENAQVNYEYSQIILENKRSLRQAVNEAKTQVESTEKELEGAEESYNQAQNNLEQARKDYERTKSLYEDDAATREQYENAETNLENARSNLKSAESNLESLRINYKGAQTNYEIAKENLESPTELEQQAESSRTQVNVSEANVNMAKAELEDLESGARPEQIKAAEASVRQAEARVEQSQLEVDDTVLTSPLEGVVSEVNIEKSEMVNAGNPVLTIIQSKTLYAEAYVTADVVKDLEQGQQIMVKPKDYSEFKEGVIERIAPNIDPQREAYLVKVRVEDNNNQIRPGMFADVHLTTASQKEALVVPIKAVLDIDSSPHVYKVVDNKAVRVNISTGIVNDHWIEVLKGLAEDDRIIVSGQNNIVDGQTVEVVN